MAGTQNTDQRIRVSDPLAGAAALRPAASPVNLMIAPAPAASRFARGDGELGSLAESLKSVVPELDQYLKTEQIASNKADLAAGKVAFMKNRMGWNEAIKQGLIPAGASPHFRSGWMQSQLQVAGFDYDEKLRQFYTDNSLSQVDDPNQFRAAVEQFNADYLKKAGIDQYDPADVAEAFLPMMKSAQESLTSAHINDRVKLVEDETKINTQNILSKVLTNGIQQDHFDTDATASAMQKVVDNAVQFGLNGTEGNKMLVDSIISTAKMASDNGRNPAYAHEILGVLYKLNTPFGPVANTNYAKEKIGELEKSIQQETEGAIRWQWALEDRPYQVAERQWAVHAHQQAMVEEQRGNVRWQDYLVNRQRQEDDFSRKTLTDQALKDINLQAIQNPFDPQLDDKIKALNEIDAKAASEANSWVKNYKHGVFDGELTPEGNLAWQNFYLRLSADPSSVNQIDIINAQNQFHLPMSYAQRMHDDMVTAKKYEDNPLMKDEAVVALQNALNKAVGGSDFDFDGTAKQKAGYALLEFMNAKMDWLKNHPQGSVTDYRAFMRQQYDLMLKTYGNDITSTTNAGAPVDPKAPSWAKPQ